MVNYVNHTDGSELTKHTHTTNHETLRKVQKMFIDVRTEAERRMLINLARVSFIEETPTGCRFIIDGEHVVDVAADYEGVIAELQRNELLS